MIQMQPGEVLFGLDVEILHKNTFAYIGHDATVAAGRAVFQNTACVNCHTLDGTIADGRFGPDLSHLMSRSTIVFIARAAPRVNAQPAASTAERVPMARRTIGI